MKHLHDWNLSYKKARQIQLHLACKVKIAPIKNEPKLVAGLDCAFSKDGKKIVAAAVVLNSEFHTIEAVHVVENVSFPYIPGLLSFREAPACIAVAQKLHTKPDIFLVDGQGLAHPRRFGIACHLGLWLDKPTIGCAKSKLIGSYKEPALQKGAYSLLKDTISRSDPQIISHGRRLFQASSIEAITPEPRATSDEIIGAVLRTRTNVKPMFVSIGHKCTLEDAIRLVLAWTDCYRLPEPIRMAHQLVTRLKSKI